MRFRIEVINDRTKYRLSVEQIEVTSQLEKYKVSGNNRSIIIQSNRPILKQRNLKHKKISWKMIEGQLHNVSFLEKVMDGVESYLKTHDIKNP